MKVYISNYRYHWHSPYPLVAKIFRTDDWDDPRVEKWAESRLLQGISKGIEKFLNFVYPRIIYVKIDKYDTWNMDSTLKHIIVPMLKQLKETKHGAPFVDDEDVPEELKSTSAPPKKDEWDVDDNHFKRWDYVMDEMIYAFETDPDLEDISMEEYRKINEKKQKGYLLFGKYYQCLWD